MGVESPFRKDRILLDMDWLGLTNVTVRMTLEKERSVGLRKKYFTRPPWAHHITTLSDL